MVGIKTILLSLLVTTAWTLPITPDAAPDGGALEQRDLTGQDDAAVLDRRELPADAAVPDEAVAPVLVARGNTFHKTPDFKTQPFKQNNILKGTSLYGNDKVAQAKNNLFQAKGAYKDSVHGLNVEKNQYKGAVHNLNVEKNQYKGAVHNLDLQKGEYKNALNVQAKDKALYSKQQSLYGVDRKKFESAQRTTAKEFSQYNNAIQQQRFGKTAAEKKAGFQSAQREYKELTGALKNEFQAGNTLYKQGVVRDKALSTYNKATKQVGIEKQDVRNAQFKVNKEAKDVRFAQKNVNRERVDVNNAQLKVDTKRIGVDQAQYKYDKVKGNTW